MPDALAVENVTVFYGTETARIAAVNNVSLAFQPGTLSVIMGPSGSGKTTLLSVLGLLLRPDSGRVLLNGIEAGELSEDERTRLRRDHVGFVFQAFRLMHALSTLENVLLARDIRGPRTAEDSERAEALLAELGLGSKLYVNPKDLSGGEKQRVAIARALFPNPGVLLADEPTASLDSQAGAQIRELLGKLTRERRMTTVVVSHDPRWTECADCVVFLEDGRVVKERTTAK
ncbi:MAG TPA: ABC transporter ATP-binding protein [Bryobacteraceae bacterium]|nr:ABC transporter ATP-binding protein [Bryobacteraceae bacterium]